MLWGGWKADVYHQKSVIQSKEEEKTELTDVLDEEPRQVTAA